ncbi:MAG: DUF423 domain-containing protein [Ignavibacteria bacterium]|nr:DUF423 domain-containing protein [Ignavibacteria bacterium]MBI3766307.1 DUF423 domain-containing protein [Ignavibacteriales bacterium]
MAKVFLIIGSLSAFLAVALGAFAAHALKTKLTLDLFNIWEVGVRYHMYHALALFAVAWVIVQFPDSNVSLAGWFFVAGTVIFSGSLYALSLSGVRWIGAITPLGGVCFIAGWVWLAWSVWKSV